jgi:hypothetical protein
MTLFARISELNFNNLATAHGIKIESVICGSEFLEVTLPFDDGMRMVDILDNHNIENGWK